MKRHPHSKRPIARGMAGGALAFLLASCAPTEVRSVGDYSGAPLPRPDVVLVSDFAVVPPTEVKLDRGVSARLAGALSGSSPTEQEIAAGW
jgi:hypothetical protein